MMRTWVLGMVLLLSACAPRHAAITSATPIGAGGHLIGNDGGSLITNDGGGLIGNDGASILDAKTTGIVRAPIAADAIDASTSSITLGAGTGQASSDLTAVPVQGASVVVREAKALATLGLAAATTDAKGHFAAATRATGANLLYEASGTTGDGQTLRLLGLFGKDESVSLDLASTLAAVRVLQPGATAGTKRPAVQLGSLRASIASALAAHPTEALAAARLLASDANATFTIGGLEDLENALVALGKADATLQAALSQVDATLAKPATSMDTAAAKASDAFAAAHP